MHFEVGRIVPFVRITKLTVVLLKENTGGKSDPVNPVNPYKRKDCVGEHSTLQVCFSLFFQSRILTSRTCLSGEGDFQVKVNFAEVFQNFALIQGLES